MGCVNEDCNDVKCSKIYPTVNYRLDRLVQSLEGLSPETPRNAPSPASPHRDVAHVALRLQVLIAPDALRYEASSASL